MTKIVFMIRTQITFKVCSSNPFVIRLKFLVPLSIYLISFLYSFRYLWGGQDQIKMKIGEVWD